MKKAKLKKIFFFSLFVFNGCQSSLWKENDALEVLLPVKDFRARPATVDEQANTDKDLSPSTSGDSASSKNWQEDQSGEGSSIQQTKNASAIDSEKFSLFPQNQMTPPSSKNAPLASRTKNQPIHYSGDVFIREKKYHPRLKKKVPVLTIRGHARVKQGSTALYTEKIDIIGEKGEIFIIPSRVKIIDSASRSSVQADYAEYHRFSKTAFFKKNCRITHQDKKNKKTVIRSHELQQDFQNNISYAYGDVIITNDNYSAKSQRAIYWQNTSKLALQEKAYIYQTNTVYHAQEISFTQEPDIMEMNRDVFIWNTESKATEEKTPDPKNSLQTDKIVTFITAQRAKRELKKQDASLPKQYITRFFSSPQKQMQLTRDNIFFYADQATLVGANEMTAKGHLSLIDREGGHQIFAEQGSFSTDGKLIQFYSAYREEDSHKKLILPKAILANEEKNPSIVITSNHLEKDDHIGKISGRGKVVLEILAQKEKPTTSQKLYEQTTKRASSIFLGCELAEFPTDGEDIFLSGNPYVLQEGDKIFARKIIVNLNKKNIKLEGNLQSDAP